MKNFINAPSSQGKSFLFLYMKYKLLNLSPEEVNNKISAMIKENSIDQQDINFINAPSSQGKSFLFLYMKYKLLNLSPEEVNNKISAMIKENSIDQQDINWAKHMLK